MVSTTRPGLSLQFFPMNYPRKILVRSEGRPSVPQGLPQSWWWFSHLDSSPRSEEWDTKLNSIIVDGKRGNGSVDGDGDYTGPYVGLLRL